MGKPTVRYVARAVAGTGWRVWDRKMKKWWGNPFPEFPERLLNELNGQKRPNEIVRLSKNQIRIKNK